MSEQPIHDLPTRLVHHEYTPPAGFAAPQPAVHKASTVIFPNVAAMREREWKDKSGYTYGLHGTPTTYLLEERLATLEGGRQCLLVPSGLAAIATVSLALLRQGDEVLIPDNAYGPNKALAEVELRRARAIAAPLLAELREAVGLRRFAGVAAQAAAVKVEREALPQVKQYREADGQFYFKLLSAEGDLLLQSAGHASPKEAGQALQRLRQCSEAELAEALAGQVGIAERQRIASAFAALQAAEADRKARGQAG